MTDCEVELDLSWKKDCVLVQYHNCITCVDFKIRITNLYVPVVLFSINDNIKFLKSLKQGFKRKVSWKKNRGYMIDTAFKNINRLSVQSSKSDENDPTRIFFVKYYMPLVEINHFNALIDNKPFFDQPVKDGYEKLVEVSRIHNYTTGNLLGYRFIKIIKIYLLA